MKLKKALGPSGIAVEMIQASDDKGASKICGLAAAINCNGKVLSYWEQSFIASTRVRRMHGKGESPCSKANEAGHESLG